MNLHPLGFCARSMYLAKILWALDREKETHLYFVEASVRVSWFEIKILEHNAKNVQKFYSSRPI